LRKEPPLKRLIIFLCANAALVALATALLYLAGADRCLADYGAKAWMVVAFCVASGLAVSFLSLSFSKLAFKLSTETQVIKPHGPGGWLYRDAASLAVRLGLPAPEVGVYDASEANAYAMGASEKSSLVALSTGMMDALTRDQVKAILAHEVAHIANGDLVLLELIQGALNGLLLLQSRVLVGLLFSGDGHGDSAVATAVVELLLWPLAMALFYHFSRQAEYRADLGAAGLVGKARVIGALEALARVGAIAGRGRAPSGMGFMGLSTVAGLPRRVFSSHPTIKSRIARLNERIPG
jgi:heat shock protein HtpX